MNGSKRRYWLQGGLIFLVVGILLIGFQYLNQCVDNCPAKLIDKIFYITVIPIVPLVDKIMRIEDNWLTIIFPLYFFIAGAFIGWIYGLLSTIKQKV